MDDDGGAAAVGNVLTHVRHDGEDVAGSPQPGIGEPNGSLYTLDAGTYVVSGDGVPGYDVTVSGDCGENGSITLGLDEDAICVVTADDVKPTLRVITEVVNNSGGDRHAEDFLVHVRRDDVDVVGSPARGLTGSEGRLYTLQAGDYAVSADGGLGTRSLSLSSAVPPAPSLWPSTRTRYAGSPSTIARPR